MVYHILVGSYTDTIVTLAFDAEKRILEQIGATKAGNRPSWLASYPGDDTLIFAALEGEDGQVAAFRYDREKAEGTVFAQKSTGGQAPCALWVMKYEIFASNYLPGALAVLPITPELPHFVDSAIQVIPFKGVGPNKERQEQSHAHYAVKIPEYDEVLVADLGADKIWRLKKEGGQYVIRGGIPFAAGAGPRHFAVYEGILYTICELSDVVTAHSLPPLPKEAELLDSVPLASPPNLPAELLIPPPNATFPTPYIYVSDRNDPSPEGDLISILEPVDASKKLKLVAQVRSGLNHLRGLVFGGPDDKYLIAGGQNGGGVKVFERVDGGKGLKEIVAKADVELPTHFLWV
ncbi:Lactonase, 7-bladed beta-propeller-domain-containing protein [Schizophyllum commune]